MKLDEIFDTERTMTIGNSPLSNRGDLTSTERGGLFGHVIPDKDPHMVNKISHKHDPSYNKYANFLATSKIAQGNPHFPRIYQDKTYISTKTGNKKLWKMEKLPYTFQDFTTVRGDYETSLERIQHIAHMYLNDELASQFDNIELEGDEWEDRRQIIHVSDGLFKYLKMPNNIKLDSYKDALELIYNRKMGGMDLHDRNIMIRTTPQGPQLVFTDPYA